MLYQDNRPNTFDEVVGNKQTVESLKSLVRSPKHPHVYLFQGPKGCGKTTLGRILVRCFGATDLDIVEINCGNANGIEMVRSITEGASLVPMFSKARAYIFDEAHKITDGAQDALLKLTEDCPPQAYFVFCSTDPQKIKPTLRDRCAPYTVQSLRLGELTTLIKRVAAKEKIVVQEKTYGLLYEAAQGSVRSALMILEQIAHIDDQQEIETFIHDFAVSEKSVLDICKELLTVSPKRWDNCHRYLQGMTGVDPEQFRLAVMKYFQKVLLGTTDLGKQYHCIQVIELFEKPVFNNGFASVIKMIFNACLIDD